MQLMRGMNFSFWIWKEAIKALTLRSEHSQRSFSICCIFFHKTLILKARQRKLINCNLHVSLILSYLDIWVWMQVYEKLWKKVKEWKKEETNKRICSIKILCPYLMGVKEILELLRYLNTVRALFFVIIKPFWRIDYVPQTIWCCKLFNLFYSYIPWQHKKNVFWM